MSTQGDYKPRLPRLPRLLRRLTLNHDGRPFLDRWGLVWDRLGGFYIHHIAGPDPGLDLHDHPWSFVTVVLRGAYTDLQAPINAWGSGHAPARTHDWGRGRTRVHRMPLGVAHRIVAVEPGTWTLVPRGPTRRVWGFFVGNQRVPWTEYDYETRRPSTKS